MTYPEFESAWLGKRVDTDGYPVGAIYQCVDLIKEYLNQVFSIPYGAFGNAIDYWANTVPAIAATNKANADTNANILQLLKKEN